MMINPNPFYIKKEASCQKYLKASMSIEAVVIIPMFICFMVFIMFLFRVLEVQITMEKALRYTSSMLSVTACDSYDEETKTAQGGVVNLAEAEAILMTKLDEYQCPTAFIDGGKMGISLLSSDFDGEDISVRASYDMSPPVNIFGRFTYHFIQCSTSRKWIGDPDIETNTSGEGDEKNEWVYITPNGTVYHLTRGCHYLDLSIREVASSNVFYERNASGGKYNACPICKKNKWKSFVYITDYGESYHSSLTCSGLKRTIMMIRKKEAMAKGYGCCSKCSASAA